MRQYDSSEFIEPLEAKDLKPELERAAACRAVNQLLLKQFGAGWFESSREMLAKTHHNPLMPND